MRIVILTNDNFFSFIVLEYFLKERRDQIKLIVFSSALIGKRKAGASVRWSLKETGLRHTAYKLLVYGTFRCLRLVCRLLPFLKNRFSSLLWVQRNALPYIISPDINQKEVVDRIRREKPDLIVSVSMNQIVKRDILEIPPHRCINVHCAPLPRYGGISPYVWALANNEDHSAATIHYMDEGLDTGDIIVQEKVGVVDKDSAFALFYRCCRKAAELLLQVVEDIENGRVTCYAQDMSNKSYFSWPDKACVKSVRRNGYCLARISDFFLAIFKQKPGVG